MKRTNLVGKKFGRLTVVDGYSKGGRGYSTCECECGNKINLISTNLTRRICPTTSCGCLQKELLSNRRKKKSGTSVFNHIYSIYKNSAKRKGLPFSLTKTEFKALIDSDCVYCGRPPGNVCKVKKLIGEYIYNGIDRIDNFVGYLPENSVSCCKSCNYMKGKKTKDEFREQILKIHSNWIKIHKDTTITV